MALATRDVAIRDDTGRDDDGRDDEGRDGSTRDDVSRDDAGRGDADRDATDLDGSARDNTNRVGPRRATSSNGTAVTLASKTAVDNQMKRLEKSILPRCYCKCCDRSVLTATFMRFYLPALEICLPL